MALQDPVAVFTASSNLRAQELCHFLARCGVEAYAAEDYSAVGLWMGGTLPGIHSPKIWVSRVDAERAAELLEEHAEREKELQAKRTSTAEEERVQAACAECGESASFPASQRGSVQECPHCGHYMDVGADEEIEDWQSEDEDGSAESEES